MKKETRQSLISEIASYHLREDLGIEGEEASDEQWDTYFALASCYLPYYDRLIATDLFNPGPEFVLTDKNFIGTVPRQRWKFPNVFDRLETLEPPKEKIVSIEFFHSMK